MGSVELVVDLGVIASEIISAKARNRQVLIRPRGCEDTRNVSLFPWMQVDQVTRHRIEAALRDLVAREGITDVFSGCVLTRGSGIENWKTAAAESEISAEHGLARDGAGHRFKDFAVMALDPEEEERAVFAVVYFWQVNGSADRAGGFVVGVIDTQHFEVAAVYQLRKGDAILERAVKLVRPALEHRAHQPSARVAKLGG